MLNIQYLNFTIQNAIAHKKVNEPKVSNELSRTSSWKPELSKRCSRSKKTKAFDDEWWVPELSKRCSRKKN